MRSKYILPIISMLILFSICSAAFDWSADFISPPTPFDGAILSEHTVNINVTIQGHTIEEVENVMINNAWIDLNGGIHQMSGSGFSWSYVNNTLDKGGYTYRVYVNDSFGNINQTETRTFSVPSYVIYFNVTDGDTGLGVNNINITCDYTGFNQNDMTNTYGPYEFPVGSWSCTFSNALGGYYTKTQSFTADDSKNVSVIFERELSLTNQEHDWLRDIYECLHLGNCDAYNWWSGTYQNVSRIWNEYIPTNISVVATETFTSKTLSSTNNITIDYTLNIPYKKGVDSGALLPIRIFYWFTNSSGACFNQDKQTTPSNRAETPYCIPLMAEYLGPNNGTTSFHVELKPNLPSGTYEVVRQIDIDPPVNGVQTWINYGREKIGSIKVNNPVKESESVELVTVEGKAPPSSSPNPLTGMAVSDANDVNISLSSSTLIGLAMLCLTILGMSYLRKKP